MCGNTYNKQECSVSLFTDVLLEFPIEATSLLRKYPIEEVSLNVS